MNPGQNWVTIIYHRLLTLVLPHKVNRLIMIA